MIGCTRTPYDAPISHVVIFIKEMESQTWKSISISWQRVMRMTCGQLQ
jgi:hypothetical protein